MGRVGQARWGRVVRSKGDRFADANHLSEPVDYLAGLSVGAVKDSGDALFDSLVFVARQPVGTHVVVLALHPEPKLQDAVSLQTKGVGLAVLFPGADVGLYVPVADTSAHILVAGEAWSADCHNVPTHMPARDSLLTPSRFAVAHFAVGLGDAEGVLALWGGLGGRGRGRNSDFWGRGFPGVF